MTVSAISRGSIRRVRPDAPTHRFAIGQTVRLIRRFGGSPQIAETYRVTGTLPPRDNSLQYRIRNDGERHERVVTEDSLEAGGASQSQEDASLMERVFS